ncbi:hypothetical protein [Micromonospora sp. NPDC048898]|uniref:hypothetical protein n=1 Tax=Micromonospora sp. NPDC048898 TaxID=3364260 RepID=UPI00371BDD70
MSWPRRHRGFQEAESIKPGGQEVEAGGQEAESINARRPSCPGWWVVTRARPAQNGSVERRRDE